MLYQQGDVLLESVEGDVPELEENTRARRDGKLILRTGEATGHAHYIEENGVSLMQDRKAGVVFVLAAVDFTVKHQEHHAITLPKGLYKMRVVKEYDHFREREVWLGD